VHHDSSIKGRPLTKSGQDESSKEAREGGKDSKGMQVLQVSTHRISRREKEIPPEREEEEGCPVTARKRGSRRLTRPGTTDL